MESIPPSGLPTPWRGRKTLRADPWKNADRRVSGEAQRQKVRDDWSQDRRVFDLGPGKRQIVRSHHPEITIDPANRILARSGTVLSTQPVDAAQTIHAPSRTKRQFSLAGSRKCALRPPCCTEKRDYLAGSDARFKFLGSRKDPRKT